MKNTRIKSFIPPISSLDFAAFSGQVLESFQKDPSGARLVKVRDFFMPQSHAAASALIGSVARGDFAHAGSIIDFQLRHRRYWIFNAIIPVKVWFSPSDPKIVRMTQNGRFKGVHLLDAFGASAVRKEDEDVYRQYLIKAFSNMWVSGVFGRSPFEFAYKFLTDTFVRRNLQGEDTPGRRIFRRVTYKFSNLMAG